VTASIWDYSFQGKPVLERFGLAKSNYDDALFIHPPVFVYLSAALAKLLNFSLPLVSIIYHLITLIALPRITKRMELNSSAGIWAMIIFSFSPIAWFCSQKFWIDNCLLMTTTVSVLAHIYLCTSKERFIRKQKIPSGRNSGSSSNLYSQVYNIFPERMMIFHHFISGFIFGAFAMNTKITAAALLPFHLLWSAFHRLLHHTKVSDRQLRLQLSSIMIVDVFIHWIFFACGCIFGHGPWIALYYVSFAAKIKKINK